AVGDGNRAGVLAPGRCACDVTGHHNRSVLPDINRPRLARAGGDAELGPYRLDGPGDRDGVVVVEVRGRTGRTARGVGVRVVERQALTVHHGLLGCRERERPAVAATGAGRADRTRCTGVAGGALVAGRALVTGHALRAGRARVAGRALGARRARRARRALRALRARRARRARHT